jgi:thymidylate synthase
MNVKDIKINHRYSIPFERITNFVYEQYDEKIGVKEYEPVIEPQIPYVIDKLNNDKTSRQAVIVVNQGAKFMSCLMNLQFQIMYNILYVTVNIRSQAVEYMYQDGKLFMYIATKVLDRLKDNIKPHTVHIDVNVGNFHRLK